MQDQSRIQHPERIALDPDNVPMTSPIYQSVKFALPTVEDIDALFHGDRQGFFYSRKGNPTVRQLEVILAEQQGCEDAVAFASGIGAINALYMTILSAGDQIVLFQESYMPARMLSQRVYNRFGVKTTIVGMGEVEKFKKILQEERPKLVLFESPTNPMLRIANIAEITKLCNDNGVICAMDNTFAGIHQHSSTAVDLYLHSLTKYVGGHGDVMGGVICGSSEMIRKVRAVATEVGACLDPHAAFLLLRGLKTYYIRRERQEKNAAAVARWLEESQLVSNVFYPGLPSHPEHALATKQMKDFGSLVCFDLPTGSATLDPFLNRLDMIQIAASVGSTETIVAPVCRFFAADMDDAVRESARIHSTSLRLSVGIETVEDIIHDLQQALTASK